MLAMSSLMMPVPAMLGASQLVHKPPEAKLLTIHSAHSQHQATPQHNYQQQNHMQQQHQQQQQQQSKPGEPFVTSTHPEIHSDRQRIFFLVSHQNSKLHQTKNKYCLEELREKKVLI